MTKAEEKLQERQNRIDAIKAWPSRLKILPITEQEFCRRNGWNHSWFSRVKNMTESVAKQSTVDKIEAALVTEEAAVNASQTTTA